MRGGGGGKRNNCTYTGTRYTITIGTWCIVITFVKAQINGTGEKKKKIPPKTETRIVVRSVLTNFSIWNQPLDKRTTKACDCFGIQCPVIAKSFCFLLFSLSAIIVSATIRRCRRRRSRRRVLHFYLHFGLLSFPSVETFSPATSSGVLFFFFFLYVFSLREKDSKRTIHSWMSNWSTVLLFSSAFCHNKWRKFNFLWKKLKGRFTQSRTKTKTKPSSFGRRTVHYRDSCRRRKKTICSCFCNDCWSTKSAINLNYTVSIVTIFRLLYFLNYIARDIDER